MADDQPEFRPTSHFDVEVSRKTEFTIGAKTRIVIDGVIKSVGKGFDEKFVHIDLEDSVVKSVSTNQADKFMNEVEKATEKPVEAPKRILLPGPKVTVNPPKTHPKNQADKELEAMGFNDDKKRRKV